ncbi:MULTISPECIES: CPCC family cysteine-rich protein [Streptomyces]|nr:CPCC family cysteine-rich protein [Streptomyces goshikiensis]
MEPRRRGCLHSSPARRAGRCPRTSQSADNALLESRWVRARLALKMGGMHLRYPCVCCGHLTLNDGPDSHQICPVCFWEDDVMHVRWPDRAGGANRSSLLDAQRDFIAIGACEGRFLEHVRPPDGDEPLDPNWRPIDLSRDRFESWAASVAAWPDDLTVLYWWRYRDNGFWRRG